MHIRNGNTYSVQKCTAKKVTLSVRADLVELAKQNGVNMTKLFEEVLEERLKSGARVNGSPAGIRTPVAGSKALPKSLLLANKDTKELISEELQESPTRQFPALGHLFHERNKQAYYRNYLQVSNPNQYYAISPEHIEMLFLEFETKGVSHNHKKSVEYIITNFIKNATKKHNGYYIFTLNDLKKYLHTLRQRYSPSAYRRHVTYIKKLLRVAGIDLVNVIKTPQEVNIDMTIVTVDDIRHFIQLLEGLYLSNRFEEQKYDQMLVAMLLMATSGMRVSELARVPLKDMDIENRRIYLNTSMTKTKQARVTFFTKEVQELLQHYIDTYNPPLADPIATVPQLQRPFRKKSPLRNQKLRPKHMRKFFAQEWDRRNGNATIKKMLMGHSIRYDINALHYSHHTIEEIQEIYDKVFGNLRFLG
nr:tyrosine-type recombinase/integrase [Thermococcus sp. LS2]